jgi:SAM-dependent methyltransferase
VADQAEVWETAQREALRLTFDVDADAYDRSRPVAPDHVFDDVIRLGGLTPGSRVVEIGPGTGQATRPLAARGIRVLALEVGPNLAERARTNLAGDAGVEVLHTSFEAWASGGERFDAVFACNSFHWLDPDIRFAKAASILRSGGHLVVLATPWIIPDDADRFWWDVQDDYVAVGSARVDPASAHPDRVGDLGPAVRASGLFDDPTIRRYRFDVEFTADEYAINLSTRSGTKELGPEAGAHLVSRIRRRIESHGGSIMTHLLAVLTVARVRTAAAP